MLPTFRRFTQSDIPSAPNWISNVFGPLNTFCEQTVQVLNRNLIIGENVQGQKFTASVTTDTWVRSLQLHFVIQAAANLTVVSSGKSVVLMACRLLLR